jgi:hypothetical protein
MRQPLLIFANACSVETKFNFMNDVITISMQASDLATKNNIIEAMFGNTKLYLQSLNETFKEPRNTPAIYSPLW